MRHKVNERQIEDYNKEINAIYNFRIWLEENNSSQVAAIQAVDKYIVQIKALKHRAYRLNREILNGGEYIY